MTNDTKLLEPDGQTRESTRDPLLHVDAIPQRALLRLLASSHRRGVVEPRLITSLARGFKGNVAMRLDRLSSLIASGTPTLKALGQVPHAIDASALMALDLAEQDGRLGAMYDVLLESCPGLSQQLRSSHESPEKELLRSTVGMFLAYLILTFLMVFVLPTFEKMFDEFGIELPRMLVILFAAKAYVPFVLLAFFLLVFAYCVWNSEVILWAFFSRFRPLAWEVRAVPSPIKLLSLLAIATESDRPLDAGIASLAQSHPNSRLRVQLKQVATRISRGQEAIPALAAERVLTQHEATALGMTRSTSARAWLLRWFAAKRWERSQIWAPLFARTLATFSTLFLGFIVAWTAIGVMMALVSLIAGLS